MNPAAGRPRAAAAASSPTAIAVFPCPDEGALTTRRGWAVINGTPDDYGFGDDVLMTAGVRTLPSEGASRPLRRRPARLPGPPGSL
ncbi:hypothetical protein KRMM14A1259_59600 [Krasilnikovia sp. MM14-A1259]